MVSARTESGLEFMAISHGEFIILGNCRVHGRCLRKKSTKKCGMKADDDTELRTVRS